MNNKNSPYRDFEASIKNMNPIQALIMLVCALRDKKFGCAWDRQQKIQDIAPLTIEEAYEIAHAVEENDIKSLKEELGDMLFHIVLYSQIAKENDLFDFDDIALTITQKMIKRHPHVFNDKQLSDAELYKAWESHKPHEKLKSVWRQSYPSLLLASRIGKVAARDNFDWKNTKQALKKVYEELAELEEVLEKQPAIYQEELGDLLFASAQVARKMKISPEYALRKASKKFVKRYNNMKNQTGYDIALALNDKEFLWQKTKTNEKIEFIKMNGLGNDFVIIDARHELVDLNPSQIRKLSDRKTGIGFDQMVLLLPPESPDTELKVVFYNADGNKSAACGNASRCVGWLTMEENGKRQCSIETDDRVLKMKRVDELIINVDMGIPSYQHSSLPDDPSPLLANVPEALEVLCVSMGNPHVVFVVPIEQIEKLPLSDFAPEIEKHSLFPEKCNVGIVALDSNNSARLRVWERGVGITKACGTGACAAKASLDKLYNLDSTTKIILDGGNLNIYRDENQHLWMSGNTEINYKGIVYL